LLSHGLPLVLLANAADVDFLPGVITGNAVAFHHGVTHSFLFAIAVGLAVARSLRIDVRLALLTAVSHPILDWLTGEPGADVATYGVALCWPLPTRYMCDWHLFGAYHIDSLGLIGGVLTPGAVVPMFREVGFVGTCLAIGWALRRARPASRSSEP
jgi:membrane-bound metal-dependent hydrolase YbcI (DUF457 family)